MRYHGIMFDAEGTIRGFRRIDREDDYAAVDAAREVLRQSKFFDAIELWREGERVARLARPGPGRGASRPGKPQPALGLEEMDAANRAPPAQLPQ